MKNILTDPSGDAPAAIIESNPNVLNAEIDFMSTPLSQQYLAGSSDAIKNIQAKCADDYITKCLVPNVPTGAEMSVSQIGTTLTKVMLPRRLITADEFTNTPLLSFKQQVKKASDVANLVFKKSPTIPENSILRKPSADQKKLIEHRTNVLEHHQNKFKTQVEEVRHLRGETTNIYHLQKINALPSKILSIFRERRQAQRRYDAQGRQAQSPRSSPWRS